MRYKVAIRFAIDGDLRFISHHDTMRLFERAISRAQLPVKFSEGFNPRPRMSLPLPRAVGVASEADVVVFDLDEPFGPAEFQERLASQMPAGLTLFEAWPVEGKSLQADLVDYSLDLPNEHTSNVSEAAERLMAGESCLIEREAAEGRRERTIDVRAFLTDAGLKEGRLNWTVRVTNSGSVRPAELLTAVGLDPLQWHHKVRRTSVRWAKDVPADHTIDTVVAIEQH